MRNGRVAAAVCILTVLLSGLAWAGAIATAFCQDDFNTVFNILILEFVVCIVGTSALVFSFFIKTKHRVLWVLSVAVLVMSQWVSFHLVDLVFIRF